MTATGWEFYEGGRSCALKVIVHYNISKFHMGIYVFIYMFLWNSFILTTWSVLTSSQTLCYRVIHVAWGVWLMEVVWPHLDTFTSKFTKIKFQIYYESGLIFSHHHLADHKSEPFVQNSFNCIAIQTHTLNEKDLGRSRFSLYHAHWIPPWIVLFSDHTHQLI